MATEEITISELELADEVLGDMVIAVDTTSDTKSVSLRQLKAWLGSSLPTGFIVASLGRMTDERFTLLDGKTLARDGTYQAFCNKVIEQVQAGNWFACTAAQYEDDLLNKGQCDKFVITNDYVRIPKLGNKLYSGVINGTIPVYGNGKTVGLTDGTNNLGTAVITNVGITGTTTSYGQDVGTSSGTATTNFKAIGITTDPTKSGIEASVDNLNGDVTVYYYMVVSTEGQKSPVEIDINEVYEDLNLKADTDYVDARMPTGTILPYGGSTAPSGFLLCNGGAISRTTYAALFAVIGTTYGSGDGSTTFNLPNSGNLVTSVNTSVPVKGTGKALGFTDGTGNYGSYYSAAGTDQFILAGTSYNANVGTTTASSGMSSSKVVGITTDATKSGVVGTVTRNVLTCKHIIKY